ncbi:hypothetical protein FBZ93_10164 [Bradyrhizobium macuxiense]|uniref:TonB C-terminal domain-containing protein n=1 Tax=Bradyrhizobium macuxiense TaxID=1755647 RepID=A0A560MHA9_9BRAD|nr:TonB C-terminal domain-containing protein [Bradyrhizobium macuxiense]TWC06776.1 hypothetical protein FBZ93_10164 [Bradyrhizobium macuxiense]
MAARSKPLAWFAAPLAVWLTLSGPVAAEPEQLNTIRDVVLAIHRCWRPPPPDKAGPIDITVIVSFNREGAILGHPRISYESQEATDNDRIAYRVAVMEALQRCTPMPFTESLGGAVAGRPFAIPFRNKKYPPRSQEKRAWLLPKIL